MTRGGVEAAGGSRAGSGARELLFGLLRGSWGWVALVVFAGLVGGACNAGLIALINFTLHHLDAAGAGLVALFVALGLARLLAGATARVLVTRYTQQLLADIRRDLSRKILAAPLRQLEVIGIPRLLVALTDDVQVIRSALLNVPALVVNTAVLLGCAGYLGWLSWPTLLMIGAFATVAVGTYRLRVRGPLRSLKLARDEQDTLFRHFRALTEGIKELKVHRSRRAAFLRDGLDPTIDAVRRHNVRGLTGLTATHSLNQLFFYALIGLLLFALPVMRDLGVETLTGYILTIVYMLGPLEAAMNVLPAFSSAGVALQRVDELGLSLAAQPPEEDAQDAPAPHSDWQSLELAGVAFAYREASGHGSFRLGPIDLRFRPGELVFVAGGNGSGKSTLVKLLVGLYAPNSGEIRLDGQPVTDANVEWYRQHFSVVFSDSFVFDQLLGLAAPTLDARASDYLSRLRLDHEVRVAAGVFSTTALSLGQRKRLGLLTAQLEDRPIYVFDEWAAEQDLEFKEIFYRELLPELKARGKAVLVISHDERYFEVADRILVLEDGQLAATPARPLALSGSGDGSQSA